MGLWLTPLVIGQGLEQQLLLEPVEQLAEAAAREGDARRGAIVFFQQQSACSKCHRIGSSEPDLLGPNLVGPSRQQPSRQQPSRQPLSRQQPSGQPSIHEEAQREPVTDAYLVESVLLPSKAIRDGFQTALVLTEAGQPVTGLLVEQSDASIQLRSLQDASQLMTFATDAIEGWKILKESSMPAGQVNALSSRQQFLDLIRYLIEIRDGGQARADELQPSASLLAFIVPEYEKHVDHAGLISSWDNESLLRGEAIYTRVCANCHGSRDAPGSLPTSLRFAEGVFKNGSDPLSMYRTLTHGYGMMTPQSWMVPSQKYDVVHYIREAYLKPANPGQLTNVDSGYLAGLPPGDTRGPEPSQIEPWSAMDYGPTLAHTFEVPGAEHNIAYKGIAVRLDPGAGGVSRGRYWMLFDTDTMRTATAWSAGENPSESFIDWRSIQFNGQHGVHPRVVGKLAFTNPTGPGWANPQTSEFEDRMRVEGRDGRQYGPLPRQWAQYRGLYQEGQNVVFSYSLGSTSVLESPALLAREASEPLFLRSFEIAPHDEELVFQVAKSSNLDSELIHVAGTNESVVRLAAPEDTAELPESFEFDGEHYLQVDAATAFDVATKDFSITARIKTQSDGTIWALTADGPKWVSGGQTFFVRNGRLAYDIGWVGAIEGEVPIADGKWHNVGVSRNASTGRMRLMVDGKIDIESQLKTKEMPPNRVLRVGFTAEDFPAKSYFMGELDDVKFYQADVLGHTPTGDDKLLAHWSPTHFRQATELDQTGHNHDATVRSASKQQVANPMPIVAGFAPRLPNFHWSTQAGRLCLHIPPSTQTQRFTVWNPSELGDVEASGLEALCRELASQPIPNAARDLDALTHGGAARWPQRIQTQVQAGENSGPFAIDVLAAPDANPWLAQTRFTGLDFHPDGSLIVCSWDGDVWRVDEANGILTWARIASGLFQPLGLKIFDGQIYVTCRDQLVVLRDLNADGETDFYECFNNDHQVTEHFHEFAMGLQVDEDGNFYYAKSGEHGKPAVVPHHGTLLQVSSDGQRTKILANGFRAANGVCLNPDGSFVVTDQEGFWNPKNRINWITLSEDGRPKFYGNMLGYHDVTDTSDAAMEQPLCWITNAFDRSPGELLWVDSRKWGPLDGSLLNLSYGYGKVFLVPHEKVDGSIQGGMVELPIPNFPTGVMRGRFDPRDNQLVVCGMFAWAGNATQPGGLYRLRATGQDIHLPIQLHVKSSGLQLVFSEPLDVESVNAAAFSIKTWSLKRTANYGSEHYDERELDVEQASLAADGVTLGLVIPHIQPTWCMSIDYRLRSRDGQVVEGTIHNTIHKLAE